ncbi:MAG: hypothetical protein U0168_25975 [Nannocystaceae bacterium]
MLFVYVSDMTSDFLDSTASTPRSVGCRRTSLPTTVPPARRSKASASPLHHFWATGGGYLHEIGGGDLAAFTEPAG